MNHSFNIYWQNSWFFNLVTMLSFWSSLMIALIATIENRSISSIESTQMSLIDIALSFISSTISKKISTTTFANLIILFTSTNYFVFSMIVYFDILWFVKLFETSKACTKCLCNNEVAFFDLSILSFNAINACFDISDNVKNINVIWLNFDIILSLCSKSDCFAIDSCNDQTQRMSFSNALNLLSFCLVFDARLEYFNTHVIKSRSILFDSKSTLTLYEFDIVCFDSMFIHTSLLWLWLHNNN